MPLNFPNSPSVNDTFTSGSTSWKWNGSSWAQIPMSSAAVTAHEAASNPHPQYNPLINGPIAFRNKVINGNFDIWQRGTSSSISGYGTADRWRQSFLGSTATFSRQDFTIGQTSVPHEPRHFLRAAVSSVVGAGNSTAIQQMIEDVRLLAGKTITLSFWAKADSNKNIAVDFSQNFGTGGSAQVNFNGNITTLGLTTSWQQFIITATCPSISGKIVDDTAANHRLQFQIWFDAGSNFNARTNSLGHQSGTFDIAQVQLEEGSTATTFDKRPIAVELPLCQRYYEVGYIITSQYSLAGNDTAAVGQYTVTKRAAPTMTFTTQGTNINHGTVFLASLDSRPSWLIYSATTSTGHTRIEGRWTADADF